jgi:hypothetical protein
MAEMNPMRLYGEPIGIQMRRIAIRTEDVDDLPFAEAAQVVCHGSFAGD